MFRVLHENAAIRTECDTCRFRRHVIPSSARRIAPNILRTFSGILPPVSRYISYAIRDKCLILLCAILHGMQEVIGSIPFTSTIFKHLGKDSRVVPNNRLTF